MFRKGLTAGITGVICIIGFIAGFSHCGSESEGNNYVPTTERMDEEPAGGGEQCGIIDEKFYRCKESEDWLCFSVEKGSKIGVCTHVCNLEAPECGEDEICFDIGLEKTIPTCEETHWEAGSYSAKNCVDYTKPGLCRGVVRAKAGEECGISNECEAGDTECGATVIKVCDGEDLVCLNLSEEGGNENEGICRKQCEPPAEKQEGEDWWKNEDCGEEERCILLAGDEERWACVPKEWNTAGRNESCKDMICTPGENLICIETVHQDEDKRNKFCLEMCDIDGEECKIDEQCTCLENEICHPFMGEVSSGDEVASGACIPKGESYGGDDDDDDNDDETVPLCDTGFYTVDFCDRVCGYIVACEAEMEEQFCKTECLTGWDDKEFEWRNENCEYYKCVDAAGEDCDAQSKCVK
ncbi:MAG: hypothetical protein Kow0090_08460 [Myxococcota bacterium]